jgi:hypothetical protein
MAIRLTPRLIRLAKPGHITGLMTVGPASDDPGRPLAIIHDLSLLRDLARV